MKNYFLSAEATKCNQNHLKRDILWVHIGVLFILSGFYFPIRTVDYTLSLINDTLYFWNFNRIKKKTSKITLCHTCQYVETMCSQFQNCGIDEVSDVSPLIPLSSHLSLIKRISPQRNIPTDQRHKHVICHPQSFCRQEYVVCSEIHKQLHFTGFSSRPSRVRVRVHLGIILGPLLFNLDLSSAGQILQDSNIIYTMQKTLIFTWLSHQTDCCHID